MNGNRGTRRAAGTVPFASVLTLIALAAVAPAFAADNQATGDVNGVPGDLTDSNVFTITGSALALVKTAFLTDGTELTSGASVPSGTRVRFLIYIDNTTAVAVSNANVEDVLDPGFGYQVGTIKVANTTPTGANAATIYAAVNATTALGDPVDGTDVAGITAATVSAGSGAGNQQLDLAASAVWAMLFEVAVQ